MSPLCGQRGAALMVVLLMIVVVGLGAGMAGSTWKTILQREREAELLFRGDQYRRAIESYYKASSAANPGRFPDRLEDLLKDPRSAKTVRHLRRLYADPMTGEPFVPIRSGGGIRGLPGASQTTGGIEGVHSGSLSEPFKKGGFSEHYEEFASARSYGDWRFIYVPPKRPAGAKEKRPGSATPDLSR